MKSIRELSLRPYNGRLFFTSTIEAYQASIRRYFKSPDTDIDASVAARFVGGEGKDGKWAYIVFASAPHLAAHELSHVIFHVFGRCGLDPRDSGGEAFCYMLSQLMLDAA